jgi:hypothetical protein
MERSGGGMGRVSGPYFELELRGGGDFFFFCDQHDEAIVKLRCLCLSEGYGGKANGGVKMTPP